jgi:small subunit ribosomal protein S4
LKNKREIWKAQTRLRKYRGQARELLAKVQTGDPQSKKESDQLLMHLNRMNILPAKASLDDVLALDTETILSRRLQTLTYLKGLANTPTQARQLIAHGHVAIGNRRVTVPGYMVTKAEEGDIGYTSDSSLNDMMHPARPRSDYSPAPAKKEVKPEKSREKEKSEEPKEEQEPAQEPTPEVTGEKPKEESTTETEKSEPAAEPEPPVEKPPAEETPAEPETEPEKTEEETPSKEQEKPEEEPKKKEDKKNEEAK